MSASHRRDVAAAQAKPRYLFRASSDQSRGGPRGNTLTTIDPLARSQTLDYHSCLASIPRSIARTMLMHHFLWHYEHASEFSSWSTSLLWVLVHAIRKEVVRHDTNVLVYVLDTTNLGVELVHQALNLLDVFDLEHHEKLLEYCKGEYLVHGLLTADIGFKAVRLETLVGQGLYEVFPQLRTSVADDRLYLRVKSGLRPKYFNNVWQLTQTELLGLKRLGRCFGKSWEAVMTVAFLSMRRRREQSSRVQTLLMDLRYLPARSWPVSSGDTSRVSHEGEEEILEAEEFGRLLTALYGDAGGINHDASVRGQMDALVVEVASLGIAAEPLLPAGTSNRRGKDVTPLSSSDGSTSSSSIGSVRRGRAPTGRLITSSSQSQVREIERLVRTSSTTNGGLGGLLGDTFFQRVLDT